MINLPQHGVAPSVSPELASLWREVLELHATRAANRELLARVNAEIRRAHQERHDLEAAIKALDAQLAERLERVQEGVRS